MVDVLTTGRRNAAKWDAMSSEERKAYLAAHPDGGNKR